MKLKLSILALFILVAISVKGAVVDTLAVYSEAMKKNVQVVVVSPENNHVPKPVVITCCTVMEEMQKTWLSMKPELKDIADRDGLIFVCPVARIVGIGTARKIRPTVMRHSFPPN